jgi:hypothetical protein
MSKKLVTQVAVAHGTVAESNWTVTLKYIFKIRTPILPNMNTIRHVLHQITNDFMFDIIQHSHPQQDPKT